MPSISDVGRESRKNHKAGGKKNLIKTGQLDSFRL